MSCFVLTVAIVVLLVCWYLPPNLVTLVLSLVCLDLTPALEQGSVVVDDEVVVVKEAYESHFCTGCLYPAAYGLSVCKNLSAWVNLKPFYFVQVSCVRPELFFSIDNRSPYSLFLAYLTGRTIKGHRARNLLAYFSEYIDCAQSTKAAEKYVTK